MGIQISYPRYEVRRQKLPGDKREFGDMIYHSRYLSACDDFIAKYNGEEYGELEIYEAYSAYHKHIVERGL